MFFLTLAKVVPFQLFLLLPNVLFDQVSPVPFHLLSYGGGEGDLSNVLFQLGQFVPSHLCLWGGGGFFIDFPYGELHNVLIHSFYPLHNLLLL